MRRRERREERARERCVETARRLVIEGRYEEAEPLIREALARFPDDPELTLELGATILPDDAREAAALLRRAVELRPEHPFVLTRAATCMFGIEQYETAEEYTHRALACAPDDFVLRPDLDLLLGRLAARRGDDEVAVRLLRRAFDADPADESKALMLAGLLEERDSIEDALDVVTRALEHNDTESLRHWQRWLSSRR